MKITIAGAGAVGSYLAKMLASEQHDIILIEKNLECLKAIDNQVDVMTVHGSATSLETLKEAGVTDCDLFIAVVEIEEVNIMASILSKKLGAKSTIARIDNSEYLTPENKAHFKTLGIDYLINPEKLAIREITNMLKQTGASEMMDFSGGKLSMIAVKIELDLSIINKTLMEVSKEHLDFRYTVVAIKRNLETIIPKGNNYFLKNDLVYIVIEQNNIEKLMFYFTGKKSEYGNFKNIMILGGSKIGKRTAQELEQSFNIKLIEKDKEKSFRLADVLSKSLIINGDGRDIEFLKEEGINQMDAFIAVTGNSETNILSCLLAKQLGVKKAIAEVENMDYIDLATNMNLSSIINKKLIAASYIFRFTIEAEVSSLKCLTGTDAEVLEFVVQENSKVTKKNIKDLNFPKGSVIGGVVRYKHGFIVDGNTRIQKDDKVVVFSLPSTIQKVAKLFN